MKIYSKKDSYVFLYFRKLNFLALILTDFLYFLLFREMETPIAPKKLIKLFRTL